MKPHHAPEKQIPAALKPESTSEKHLDVTKSDHIPRWVAIGAFLLSLIGGLINVVGLLGFEQQAITHLTGTTSQLAVAAATMHFDLLVQFALILLAFVGGACLSGWLIGKSTAKPGGESAQAVGSRTGTTGNPQIAEPQRRTLGEF